MPSSTPEIFRTGYQTLFEVHLLHRYFLNVGLLEFDDDPEVAAVKAVRRAYDVRQFLRIEPSPATRELLRNQRLLFRLTSEGFRVLTAGPQNPVTQELVPTIALPPAANFTFLAYPTDPALPVYTAGTAAAEKALLPSPANPGGQVHLLTNVGAVAGPGAYTLSARVEPWPAGTPRPFAVVDVVHRDGTAQNLLKPETSGGWQFRHVLDNRHTLWLYVGPQGGLIGQLMGTHPLVRHGRIDLTGVLPFAVANPTPATTLSPDGNDYYSLIY